MFLVSGEPFLKTGIKKVFFHNLEKYCKFKAVDIFKCLKAGTTPKRGGPKEEEDEISKEISQMTAENLNNNNNNNNNNIYNNGKLNF
jgi:hypothetical protein